MSTRSTHQKKHVQNKGNRELIFKENNEEYAKVLKALGNCRFLCQIMKDGREVQAILAGKCKRKGSNFVNIKPEKSFVLLENSSASTEADWYINHIYKEEESGQLKKLGLLNTVTNRTNRNTTGTTIVTQNEAEQNVREIQKELTNDDIDGI